MSELNLLAREVMIDYLVQASSAKTPANKRRTRRTLAKLDDAQLLTMHDGLKAATARAAARLAQVEAQLTQEQKEAKEARKAASRLRIDAALTKLDGISARIRLRRSAADIHTNG